MQRVHIDFETASTVDLTKAGAYVYAESPTTRVWLMSYSWDGALIYRWRPGHPDPAQLLEHVRNGLPVVVHKAEFERVIWNIVLRGHYGLRHWPELRIEQMDCTLSRAAAMSLPLSLDELTAVLGLEQQKDMQGAALMKKMAKPRRVHEDGRIDWWEEPGYLDRLGDYCDQDIRAEFAADQALPALSPHERAVWELDQRINDRGIPVDIDMAMRAVDVVEAAKKRADKRMAEITGHAVTKCSQTANLVAWINSRGIVCDSVRKGAQDDLVFISSVMGDDNVKQALELRRSSNKSSTAKYKKTLDCVCADGRMRHLLQYHGAGPGRWAGRLVQPQNYPRVDHERDGALVEFVVNALRAGMSARDTLDMIEMGTGDPLVALSKALRGTFYASEGRRFLGGDFANIEGRVNAWIANEDWKTEAFRQYDAGVGPDLYKLAYSRSFGKPVEEVGKGQERQIGKVQELALGYQGGVGAFITMGDTYNVKTYDLVAPVQAAAGAEKWDTTAIRYEKATDKHGLPEDEWTAVKIIVTNWRAAHPNIVQSWWDLKDAAIEAVSSPGRVVPCYSGRVRYVCADNWLYCQLPSGRVLAYAAPWIEQSVVVLVNKDGEEFERVEHTVKFYGRDSVTKQWRVKALYGGLQCENIVQATARCLLDRAMLRLEAAGYPIVLTVHDEILVELEKEYGSVDEFTRLMSVVPDFCYGLPVVVSAWEDERYVK